MKEINNYHQSLGHDYTFGQTSCRPLYPDNSKSDVGRACSSMVSKIDLKAVLHRLFKEANNFVGNPVKDIANF